MPKHTPLQKTPAVQAIEDYWKKIHPSLRLEDYASDAEIAQLAWVIDSDYQTNEGAFKRAMEEKSIHIEIPRALTRLYCLGLLRTGDRPSYEAFIEAQKNHAGTTVLAFPAFRHLSSTIQSLGKDAYQVLRTSTVLSSVALSPTAKQAAEKALGTYPLDSVAFLAHTVQQSPQIYPLVQTLDPDSIPDLQAACDYPHFRHILYLEGGLGMFQGFAEKLQQGALTQENFDLWYCHWMINITGFRAQIDPNGSLYLNATTYGDMKVLKDILEYYCLQSLLPVEERFARALEEYTNKRAAMLGLFDANKYVLARLGALLRLHTPQEGEALAAGFQALDPSLQEAIIDYFQRTATEKSLTPTYSPAFFANFMAATNNDIQRTVRMCLPIYKTAMEAYQKAIADGVVSAETPLNFNELASKASIERLLLIDPSASDVVISIGSSGLASIASIEPRVGYSKETAKIPSQHEAKSKPLDMLLLGSGAGASLGAALLLWTQRQGVKHPGDDAGDEDMGPTLNKTRHPAASCTPIPSKSPRAPFDEQRRSFLTSYPRTYYSRPSAQPPADSIKPPSLPVIRLLGRLAQSAVRLRK